MPSPLRNNGRKLTPRGLVLILVAGLILAIGAAGAARRDEPAKTTAATVPATVAADPGGLEANVVRASLPPSARSAPNSAKASS